MPRSRPPTKWDPSLGDPAIRRWKENLRRGSVATGDAWFRALRRFCAESQHAAHELVKMRPKALRDLFMDFAAADEKRGVGGAYTAYTLKVARNWLRFNGVQPPQGVKVRAADSVFEETALSLEQLRAVLNAASPRERVAIVLMAQAGVRPEVIGSFEGNDGLRIGDLPELTLEHDSVGFTGVPSVVEVRRELSKASHKYVTFLGVEGTGILTDYLRARLAAGERLDADSALFPPERTDLTTRRFVRTTKIGDSVRRALRAAGLPNRPYVLRTTAASRFAEAENRGLVSHSFWQHWMGHSGDMSARYSVNRGKVPPSLFNEMRTAYKRCEPFLSSGPADRTRSESDQRLKRLVLKVAGYTDAELDKVAWETVTDEEIETMVGERVGRSATGPTQQVVPVARVEPLLAAGWEYVALLGPDRAIVRSVPGSVPPGPIVLPPRA